MNRLERPDNIEEEPENFKRKTPLDTEIFRFSWHSKGLI
jgi:hypothetical protein